MCLDKALIASLFGSLDPFDFPLICLQNNLCIVNIFFTSLTSQPEPLAIRTIRDSLMSIGSELSNSATPNKQTNAFSDEAPRRRIEFVKQGKPFASQNCVKFFFFWLAFICHGIHHGQVALVICLAFVSKSFSKNFSHIVGKRRQELRERSELLACWRKKKRASSD